MKGAEPFVHGRAREERPPALTPAERRRLERVEALLMDLGDVRRYLASVPGPASAAGAALRAYESGSHGTGCSGTKGAGMPRDVEPPKPVPEPEVYRRYRRLAPLPGHEVRRLLVEAREGVQIATQSWLWRYGKHELLLTVEQAVGWYFEPSLEQCALWATKVDEGDKRSALAGMESLGKRLLDACADEWFGRPLA